MSAETLREFIIKSESLRITVESNNHLQLNATGFNILSF